MKMMTENLLRLTVLIGLFNLPYIVAFQIQSYPINQLRCDQHTSRDVGRNTVICHESRRDVFSLFVPTTLASIALLTSNTEPSFALSVSDNNDSDTSDNDADVRARTDNDLTATLYNSDGTVKEGVEAEVKYRDVSFRWDQSDEISIHEDGADTSKSSSTTKSESDTTDTTDSSQYTLSYQIPMRWSDGKDGDPIYFDRSVGLNSKAAKGITIFQAPGKASIDRLQKATTIGVAKALDVPEQFSRLYKADIVSGRTVERGSQKYYEFDMASAPKTCGDSKDNLGLGFCPYDDLFLLSATVVNDRLYCMIVECDSTNTWKVESKELKRVRSSFEIEEAVTA